MKRATLVTALLFAAGSAFAQSNSATVNQSGSANDTQVDQSGASNTTTVDQYVGKNDAFINQVGGDNFADIDQTNGALGMSASDGRNLADLSQTANGSGSSSATIEQFTTGNAFPSGRAHEVRLEQVGYNTADIFQRGAGNKVLGYDGSSASRQVSGAALNTMNVDQRSGYSRVFADQLAGGNLIDVSQSGGNGFYAWILQDSESNTADVSQTGRNSEITILQFDDGSHTANVTQGLNFQDGQNFGTITQNGLSQLTDLVQYGDQNMATVTQSGASHMTDIMQNGNANTATVTQNN